MTSPVNAHIMAGRTWHVPVMKHKILQHVIVLLMGYTKHIEHTNILHMMKTFSSILHRRSFLQPRNRPQEWPPSLSHCEQVWITATSIS